MATAFSIDRFEAAPPEARAKAVADGFPASAVRELSERYGLSISSIARAIGPRRTIDRRLKQQESLTPEESDRYARLVNVLKLTEQVYRDPKAVVEWVESPRRAFNGAVPLDLLRTETEGKLVEHHLLRALHGIFA